MSTKEIKSVVDKRLFTTAEIEIFNSPELTRVIRKVPENTLQPYDRLVIRKGNKLAQINESDGSTSYFKYKDVTLPTEQLSAKENGIDVFKGSVEQLKGIEVESDKNNNSVNTPGPAEMFVEESTTTLWLRDDDDKEGQLLAVTIKAVSPEFELEHIQANEQFYIIDDPDLDLWCNYKRIRFENGEEKILFHKEEGMYKEINDLWAKVEIAITAILGIIIFLAGIGLIILMTGWVIIFGAIMFPVAMFLAAILTLPVSNLLKYIGRYF